MGRSLMMDLIAAVNRVADEVGRTLLSLAHRRSVEPMSPEGFAELLTELKACFSHAGLESLKAFVLACDEDRALIERDGKKFRFKEATRKAWLTSFGLLELERGYYQPDAGGDGIFPLDSSCGMSDRYLSPDLEEVAALGCAMLPPREVRTLLAKAYPRAPSVTALQKVITQCGEFAETNAGLIEDEIEEQAPLESKGDLLVVSWDGVIVPLVASEEQARRNAKSMRHALWREASVASISSYERGQNGNDPVRLDARYHARMPEPGMKRLLQKIERSVVELRTAPPGKELVIICDGKPNIWSTADTNECYAGATQILDFYHAVEHLSNVADAIFGKASDKGRRWYHKHRSGLKEVDNAIHSTMRYYMSTMRKGSKAFHVVRRALKHFSRNKDRMQYARFLSRGLPIGSGPVEAACKTVVGARLKRSGMRWTRSGGQQVLNLRVQHLSNRWDCYWRTYMADRCAA